MADLYKDNLLNLVDSYKNKNVLVIGDSILDHYIYSTAVGLALEGPTLLASEDRSEMVMGGAGNVVANLLGLEARCTFMTLLGNDSEASFYENYPDKRLTLVPLKEDRKTTVKRRFYVKRAGVEYKHLEIHKEDGFDLSKESESRLLGFLKTNIDSYDAVILADYRNGLLPTRTIKSIVDLLKENQKLTVASSQVFKKPSNHLDYSGVDLIVMNQKEAKAFDLNFSGYNRDLKHLSERLNSGVCITLGKTGAVLHSDNMTYSSSGIEVKEIDSCGAGDSFLAALVLSDPKKNPGDALFLANLWAGLSVQEIGTTVPKIKDLVDHIDKL